jgi:hypothetical protein
VREPRVAPRDWKRAPLGGRANPDRIATRPKASRSSELVQRKVHSGGDLGCRGERFGARRKACGEASFPTVLEPARRCPRGDARRQRSARFTVKAAPADEARAVHHARRRKALALRALNRASCESRKRRHDRVSLECVDRSWPVRRARPSLSSPNRANGPGGDEDAHHVRTMRGSRHVHTLGRECRDGPHTRP